MYASVICFFAVFFSAFIFFSLLCAFNSFPSLFLLVSFFFFSSLLLLLINEYLPINEAKPFFSHYQVLRVICLSFWPPQTHTENLAILCPRFRSPLPILLPHHRHNLCLLFFLFFVILLFHFLSLQISRHLFPSSCLPGTLLNITNKGGEVVKTNNKEIWKYLNS